MLEYSVSARRIDEHGSEATAKQAIIAMDTDVKGRFDAFNPAELFLASIAACLIKGAERVAPMINFHLQGVDVKMHATRQDSPPKILSVEYDLIVETDESEHRLELLHTNIRKYGTISNTVATALHLQGTIRRKS